MRRSATSPASPARHLALIAVMAGIVAALGLVPAISVPGISVPITAQTLGVMLAGALLGPRLGAAALALFIGLVALGLPLLSGARGGLGVLAGASGGFALGFILGAFVVGALTWAFVVRADGSYVVWRGLVANLLGGVVAVYALGIPWLAWRAGLSLEQAFTGSMAFVPGDLVKVVVAAVVARGVYAAYPGLGPARHATKETTAV